MGNRANLVKFIKEKPVFFIAALFAVLIVISLILLFAAGRNNNGGIGTGEEFTPESPAIALTNGEALFAAVEQRRFYDLGFDLRTYFEDHLNLIDSSTESIFSIVDTTRSGDEIIFNGKLDKFKGEYEFKVVTKPNDRMEVFAKAEDDSEFNKIEGAASNSVRNAYIAKLPVDKGNYSISYDLLNDQFIISVFVRDKTSISAAEKELRKNLEENTFKNEEIIYTYPLPEEEFEEVIERDSEYQEGGDSSTFDD